MLNNGSLHKAKPFIFSIRKSKDAAFTFTSCISVALMPMNEQIVFLTNTLNEIIDYAQHKFHSKCYILSDL